MLILFPQMIFHASEYVGEYFKCRKYITGFTGSAGRAVIMQDMAGLWTDGRYFTQALTEMEGSGVRLMKMFVDDTPSTTEWLAQKIPEGGKVAFDGRVLSMGEGQEYEEVLGAKLTKTCDSLCPLTNDVLDGVKAPNNSSRRKGRGRSSSRGSCTGSTSCNSSNSSWRNTQRSNIGEGKDINH